MTPLAAPPQLPRLGSRPRSFKDAGTVPTHARSSGAAARGGAGAARRGDRRSLLLPKRSGASSVAVKDDVSDSYDAETEDDEPEESKKAPESDVSPEWPNYLAFIPSTSRNRLPVVHFTACSPEDLRRHYIEKRRRAEIRAAGGGGPTVATPGIPQPGSPGGGRERRHVSSCTCPACRKRMRSRTKGPLKLLYKMNHSAVGLVHAIHKAHGFRQTMKDGWNSLWTSAHLKSYVFQGLNRYQKVNQFPRSYEVTRKDNLARNMRRMEQMHGERHFEFMPKSFVLPADIAEFRAEWAAQRGAAWIVKPSASARGRGIFITRDWDIATERYEDGVTVSRYIDNPLLLDGYKFDLRLYVAVTSFHPLRIYVHEEGLARFATDPYDPDPKHYENHFMHLTNYSINKNSSKFVANADTFVEDAGHKWSMTALRRRLRKAGIDDEKVWSMINDLIVKTIISVEPQVMAAVEMFVPHHSNCYELFGFDVMVDDALMPYLLEVNFAPSLACDAPLDHHIKSRVVAELLTLAGFQPHDNQAAEALSRGRVRAPVKKKGGRRPDRFDIENVCRATGLSEEQLVVPSGPRGVVKVSDATPSSKQAERSGPDGRAGGAGGEDAEDDDASVSRSSSRGRGREATRSGPGGVRRAHSAHGRDMRGGAKKRSSSETPKVRRAGSARAASTFGSGHGPAMDTTATYWTSMDPSTRSTLMSELSTEEKRAIRETEEENERRGRYIRIFPNANAYAYLPFFEGVRPLNKVVADHMFRVTAAASAQRDERGGVAPLPSEPGASEPFGERHVMSLADVRREQARHMRASQREQKKGSRAKGADPGRVYAA